MAGITIFTIGHSNRELDEFLALLDEYRIAAVVDVRRLPGSNRYPWFNAYALEASLAERGLTYSRLDGLTGRRGASREVPRAVNAWWEHRSFHNYADHAMTVEFREALEVLHHAAAQRPTAIMCAEAVWWRCHRRIIADHLLAAGDDVIHIMGPGHAVPAELSAGAVLSDDGWLTYPGSTDEPS